MITQLKKEVEHVAANYARQAAEEIVREMAKDPDPAGGATDRSRRGGKLRSGPRSHD